MKSLIDEFKRVYKYRYVIVAFIETNLKIRYRRSYLGFFWTLLAPMLHFVVIGAVFTVIMRSPIENYFQFYFLGALIFSFFSNVLGRSLTFFTSNEHFIRKIYVPKLVFVANGVFYEFVNFALAGSALLFLGVIFGDVQFTFLSALVAFLSVMIMTLFLFGMGSILAVITVYFRDMNYIIPVLLQALFFITPIIYDKSMVPEKYHPVIDFNPLYYLINTFRQPLMTGVVEASVLSSMGISFVVSLFVFLFGTFIVKKFDNEIVFRL